MGRKTEEDVRIDYTEGAPAEANGNGIAAVELGASRMEEEDPEYEEEFDEEDFKASAAKVGAYFIIVHHHLLLCYVDGNHF